jgi:hypothetical protein
MGAAGIHGLAQKVFSGMINLVEIILSLEFIFGFWQIQLHMASSQFRLLTKPMTSPRPIYSARF